MAEGCTVSEVGVDVGEIHENEHPGNDLDNVGYPLKQSE